VLEEAGLDLAHIVKTTVFLKSMADFAAMNEVYARYLAPEVSSRPPALPSSGAPAQGRPGGNDAIAHQP